ncbi:unnamed protein product [Penicillium olsonii]|nr:unnamed protein product [Penicillium olsonii]CAG7926879.1 unnamed protein product [Penicillium olsonii]
MAITRSEKRRKEDGNSSDDSRPTKQRTGPAEGESKPQPVKEASAPQRPRSKLFPLHPPTGGLRPPPITGVDIPDTVTTNWEGSQSSEDGGHDVDDPEVVQRYRDAGARYQEWIIDPALEGCPIKKATLTFEHMFSLPVAPDTLQFGDTTSYQWQTPGAGLWEAYDSTQEDIKTVGLQTGRVWDRTVVRQLGWAPKLERFKWSEYVHWVVEGAIIAAAIARYHGPHWSDVALAHYRHETKPFVKKLYSDGKIRMKKEPAAKFWAYGTDEYQGILGTAIGRGVASIVLGAWPRGTHRIIQIKSYFYAKSLQLRFDIGEIVSASGPAMSSPESVSPPESQKGSEDDSEGSQKDSQDESEEESEEESKKESEEDSQEE